MHSRMYKLTILGLILIFSMTLFASNGTQIGTVGARATAMGSAFRGLADDWSAVFFNPAGLTQLEGLTIGLSGGVIAPRGDYQAAPYQAELMQFPFSGMKTTVVDAEDKNFIVPALSVFKKLNEKMVVGLGVYAPFGLGTEWDLIELPESYGNATGISKVNEHYSDHQVINIQPTIAYQVSDKLSIGLGAVYSWGKMDLDQVKLAGNPAAAKWAALTTGLGAEPFNIPLEPLTADQYRLLVENNLSGTGSAFGVNAGLLFDVNEKLSIGASIRYSTKLALSGNFTQTYITHGDPEKYQTLAAVPDVVFADEVDATGTANKEAIAGVFSGHNIKKIDDAEVDADLPLPLNVGVGLAYKATEKLTLTLDAGMTNWASWDVITVEVPEEDGEDVKMTQDWSNTFEIGAGVEFLAKENLFIRCGFYSTASPAPDETMTPTILDPGRRNVFTGGLGYNVGRMAFNLSGEYVMFGENEVKDYVFDPETLVADNYAGIYNFKAIVVTLGASISL